MSKILRYTTEGPKVYVGEKHLDFKNEKVAQDRLKDLFPSVSVITDADGARFIPIQEMRRLEEALEQKKKEFFDLGHTQGYDSGLIEGLKQGKEVLANFENAIKTMVTQRESLLEESRKKVLELVIQICRKITYDAIEIDPQKTLKIINGVIDSLVDRSHLKIKVNPKHLQIVEENVHTFSADTALIKSIEIIADPRVKYGGCFIETPTGDIDARLSSQIDVIEDLLKTDGAKE